MNPLRVVTKKEAHIIGQKEDKTLAKVVKYIPADVVATYLSIRSFLMPDNIENIKEPALIYGNDANFEYYSIAFWGCLLLTIPYKYISLKSENLPTPFFQIGISVLAFTVWVFAFGDIFQICWEGYSRKLAAMVLIFFTASTPLFEYIFTNKKNK